MFQFDSFSSNNIPSTCLNDISRSNKYYQGALSDGSSFILKAVKIILYWDHISYTHTLL